MFSTRDFEIKDIQVDDFACLVGPVFGNIKGCGGWDRDSSLQNRSN